MDPDEMKAELHRLQQATLKATQQASEARLGAKVWSFERLDHLFAKARTDILELRGVGPSTADNIFETLFRHASHQPVRPRLTMKAEIHHIHTEDSGTWFCHSEVHVVLHQNGRLKMVDVNELAFDDVGEGVSPDQMVAAIHLILNAAESFEFVGPGKLGDEVCGFPEHPIWSDELHR